MAIKYEYNSTCCSHYYIETRNVGEGPVVTKCNVCRKGDYVEINSTEIETIPEPIYETETEE
jgi:hypothetical protein